MGLYINLTVNILDLSPAKWEQTYQESCRLLECFPVPLMRFKSEESYKHQRYMYTADVISQKGSQEEHWSVSGDLVSRLGRNSLSKSYYVSCVSTLSQSQKQNESHCSYLPIAVSN